MTKTTSEVIKELVQQINLKEISTKDFASEMKGMYEKIENLEIENEDFKTSNEQLLQENGKSKDKLAEYKKEFVAPALEYKKLKEGLDKKHQEWQVESKYIIRENDILREVLGNVVAIRNVNTYDGHGASYNESFVKPNLSPLKTEPKND